MTTFEWFTVVGVIVAAALRNERRFNQLEYEFRYICNQLGIEIPSQLYKK